MKNQNMTLVFITLCFAYIMHLHIYIYIYAFVHIYVVVYLYAFLRSNHFKASLKERGGSWTLILEKRRPHVCSTKLGEQQRL